MDSKYKNINDNSILKADGDVIRINEICVNFNELFNMAVVNKLNEKASEFEFDSLFVNEIYRDYFVPLICIEMFLEDKTVSFISIKNANNPLRAILLDYARLHGIRTDYVSSKVWNELKYGLYIGVSFCYLELLQFTIKKNIVLDTESKTISFCRTPAAYKKIKKVLSSNVLYETAPGKGDIYEQLSFVKRLKCLKKTIPQHNRIKRNLKEWLMSNGYSNIYSDALSHYRNRIIHTLFYENVIDEILNEYDFSEFITGNNLDRFAVCEEKIAKKQGIKLVCIPHGIEYGYKFPKCFVGDVFYTTSQYAEYWLNNLYEVKKFTYDSILMDDIFGIKEFVNSEHRIVFFSEPRESEVSVQIIREICECLKDIDEKLFVKLHPKDNYENYKNVIDQYEIGVITNLNEALSGNCCIARKSTTLVEAIHNNSKAYAIIVNEKDKSIFNTFPSLQDSSIKYFEDVNAMMKDITENYL